MKDFETELAATEEQQNSPPTPPQHAEPAPADPNAQPQDQQSQEGTPGVSLLQAAIVLRLHLKQI